MSGRAFMLIISIFAFAHLADAHITPEFTERGQHHEDRVRDGQTQHVHVGGGNTSWWVYGDNGMVSGIWGQTEVIEPLPIVNEPDDPPSIEPVDPPNNPPNNPIVPNNPQDPVVTSGGGGGTSIPQPTSTTPEAPSVESSQPTEPTPIVASVGIVEPKPLPELTITHIRVRSRPYTLFVYVQNSGRRFVSGVTLEIHNPDGELTLRHRFNTRDAHFTPQFPNEKHHPDYLSPDGMKANNLIAIAGKHVLKSWNYRKETARFRIGVRQFRAREVWTADNTIQLLIDGRVITEYPEPDVMDEPVMMSPMLLKGKLTTTWADVKRRK